MQAAKNILKATIVLFGLFGLVSVSHGHGDVQPQAVDISGLKPLGEEWLTVNPYTLEKTPDQIRRAIEIGCTAYNQNCARCHGLGVISGGTAPDLRYLEKDDDGDAWYINRIRHGYAQNGATKMPPFEGLMAQEAMWSIRAFINIRPEDDDEAVKKGTGNNCQTLDYDQVLKVKN